MKKKLFAIALLTLVFALTLSACGSKKDAASPAEAEAEEEVTVNGLSIQLKDLTEEPAFVDWEQDGIAMQLIALVNGDGEAQLAYNTCQSCAGSPYAYFEYANGLLTCQNCGNRFGLDSVGIIAGGCNPKPLGAYSVEGDVIVVPEEELAAVAPEFETWKKF